MQRGYSWTRKLRPQSWNTAYGRDSNASGKQQISRAAHPEVRVDRASERKPFKKSTARISRDEVTKGAVCKGAAATRPGELSQVKKDRTPRMATRTRHAKSAVSGGILVVEKDLPDREARHRQNVSLRLIVCVRHARGGRRAWKSRSSADRDRPQRQTTQVIRQTYKTQKGRAEDRKKNSRENSIAIKRDEELASTMWGIRRTHGASTRSLKRRESIALFEHPETYSKCREESKSVNALNQRMNAEASGLREVTLSRRSSAQYRPVRTRSELRRPSVDEYVNRSIIDEGCKRPTLKKIYEIRMQPN
ncbi:hypothetical protein Tco_1064450 [Tanacetum coccineum]